MIFSNTKINTTIPGMHGYQKKYDFESNLKDKDNAQQIDQEFVWLLKG